MLDLFLRLIDELKELAKERRDNTNRRFTEGVKYVYDDLKTVHSNYLSMFETAIQDINNDTRLPTVIARLSLNRIQLEALREELIALSNRLAESGGIETQREFFRHVSRYFVTTKGPEGTVAVSLIAALESVSKRGLATSKKKYATMAIAEVLEHIRAAWREVVDGYAHVYSKHL